ncbi:MAG: cytochrome d ubiquinol oxidase subunit II, partial [Gammaproteobacteria bacterium]
AAAVSGVIATTGLSMFPFILPSSSQPNASLTVWDAVSSHATLQIMFWVVVVLLPLVLAYTRWVYRVLGGKVSVKTVMENKHQMY